MTLSKNTPSRFLNNQNQQKSNFFSVFIFLLSFATILFVCFLTNGQSSAVDDDLFLALDALDENESAPGPQVITLKDLGADRDWIQSGTYYVLDVESTGIPFVVRGGKRHYGDPSSNRVIQLSILKYVDGNLDDYFNSYFNPGVKSTSVAYRIHRLSESFLSAKPTFAEKFDDIINFMFGSSTTATIVGHHVGTDIGLLRYEFERVLNARNDDDTCFNLIVADTLYAAKRDDERLSGAKHMESPQKPVKVLSRISEEAKEERLQQQILQKKKRKIAKENKDYKQLVAISEKLKKLSQPEEKKRRLTARRKKQLFGDENQMASDKENIKPSNGVDSPFEGAPTKRIHSETKNFTNNVSGERAQHKHGHEHKRQKVSKVSYQRPPSFTNSALAKRITGTETAGEAARVGMMWQGHDSRKIQEEGGVPFSRMNMAHEAVVDTMNTAVILKHQSDVTRPVVIIEGERNNQDLSDFVIHSNLDKLFADNENPQVKAIMQRNRIRKDLNQSHYIRLR